MFTYHYCVLFHNERGTTYIDGIATSKEKLKTNEDIDALKREIDKINAHKMIITSLTLI